MVGLAQLVNESLARHGVEANLDPRRLQWSRWFRCEDGFSIVPAPGKPGIFALGEEIVRPGELPASGGKRMLALFRIAETDDLGMALSRLFLPGSPERERFASGRCFARYAVVEDAAQRHAARVAFEQWMASSAEAVTGVSVITQAQAETSLLPDSSNKEAQIGPPSPLPAGF